MGSFPSSHAHEHTTHKPTRAPFFPADDILTGHRNQKYDAQREDKRPAEEQDEERGGAAIGED